MNTHYCGNCVFTSLSLKSYLVKPKICCTKYFPESDLNLRGKEYICGYDPRQTFHVGDLTCRKEKEGKCEMKSGNGSGAKCPFSFCIVLCSIQSAPEH